MPDWVRRLMAAVREVIPRDFVGQIEVNVFKGGISNVNVKQSYKDEAQADAAQPEKPGG